MKAFSVSMIKQAPTPGAADRWKVRVVADGKVLIDSIFERPRAEFVSAWTFGIILPRECWPAMEELLMSDASWFRDAVSIPGAT